MKKPSNISMSSIVYIFNIQYSIHVKIFIIGILEYRNCWNIIIYITFFFYILILYTQYQAIIFFIYLTFFS